MLECRQSVDVPILIVYTDPDNDDHVMSVVCFGCGAPNPTLAADYQYHTAYYCTTVCQNSFHLEAKKKKKKGSSSSSSDGKKRGRAASVKRKAKGVGKNAAKHGKQAGKVAKVVAPLVILEPRPGDEWSVSE